MTDLRAEDIFFNMDDKESGSFRRINLVDYYREFFSVVLKRPRLPCLLVSIECPCYPADTIAHRSTPKGPSSRLSCVSL